ncbi:uncharacterized protein L199_008621 [Kwoniella botswanensis]|uniref:uncharacterized protein n=1 Tax=Kwoniella botswanensis TaxID=1268659 RepID=UPI00315D5F05
MAESKPAAIRSYDIETRGVEAGEYHPSKDPLTEFGDMVTELGISGGRYDRIVTSKSGRSYETSHLIKESRYVYRSKGNGICWIESKGDKYHTYYHSTSCTSGECLGWKSGEIKRLESENIPHDPYWNLTCAEEPKDEGTGTRRLICNPSSKRLSQSEPEDSKLDEWFRSKITGGDAEVSKGWVGFHIVRPWSSTVEPYSTYWTEYKLPKEKVGSFAG